MLRRLSSTLVTRRNVAAMATPTNVPAAPLLVILGSTGTGKSDLAVELAMRFRGEIINADAMQMYNGIPIMTNKMSVPEQRGIPHHLLGHVSLREEPWDIDDYKREATETISEIRGRGNLPIVVGGTNYYVDALLFEDVILDTYDNQEPLPILEESTEVLLAELKRLDPEMAMHWHPNDRRKILRSLEICLRTGKRTSEIYAEQRERRAARTRGSPWENLLFWLYSERDVLKARLDARVDKMLDAGLLDEVRQLFDFKREEEASGRTVDMTRGIWQSIGYKQFEPYLLALEDKNKGHDELKKIKTACEEDMKTATRGYAMYQNKWTRTKRVSRLRQEGPEAVDSLYVVNSTDVSRFQDAVVEPAAELTAHFLRGEARRHPTDMSDLAREVLGNARQAPPPQTPCERTCHLCETTVTTEERWAAHIRGRRHRSKMKKKKRLALVPVDEEVTQEDGSGQSDGETSEPDLAVMFGD